MTEEGRSAVFVDLSSLNVVFKLRGKFTCALNYGTGLEHLASVMPALGTGYDIYLCLMPRAKGEGDLIIDELSLSGVPFVADSKELLQALRYFRDSSGVGDVYLCNWLANYIACARVSSFESVFFYGDRVARIEVKNRLLETFELYNSQFEFMEAAGKENLNRYGDTDLIDANGLAAQYPELHAVSKVQLTCLAPLVQSYRSPVKITTDELYERLRANYTDGTPSESTNYIAGTPSESKTSLATDVPEDAFEPPVDKNMLPVSEEIPDCPKMPVKKKRQFHVGKLPFLAKFFLWISCVLAFTIGVFCNVVLNTTVDEPSSQYFTDLDARIATLQSLSLVYTEATENFSRVSEMFDYINNSGLSVTIMGFDYNVTGSEVRCACASRETIDSFQEYIGESYTVVSTNDLGQSMGADGTVYQFSVSFM